ncbi:MAG: tRNA (adenosine(37)-N6)-threonylcarbamoyltransferase complex transferase subunit TsaD [Thermoguttaceae bacterium]
MLKILTLETTCDETAAAVVTDTLSVLGAVVASQDSLHQRFGGVVPEVASRAHLENILPVIDEALRLAGVTLDDIDAISVANTPGLAGSLLVGLVAAKTLALALQKPLIAVNHLQAHIYACRMAANETGADIFPCLGLIVSGGHTALFRCVTPLEFVQIGGTIDDAAGEAFDKVAAMLRLPYPGGPNIERIARTGNPHRFKFPQAFIDQPERLEWSFSGIKTAVRYQIAGVGKVDFSAIELSPQETADLAASFQEAAVSALVTKCVQAVRQTKSPTLCVGGGVAANGPFRERLAKAADAEKFRLVIAPPSLCTDNAVMGAIAVERYRAGLFESLELDIRPT